MTHVPSTIIAVTTEDDRHAMVIDRAADLAIETNATVILYNLDADMGPLESPLPTAWSGDGEEEQFGDRLDPNDLEAAGRSALADQVRVIRAAGIEAFGWLPPKADADALVEYATRQGAELVLVSTDDAALIDALHSTLPQAVRAATATKRRRGNRPAPSRRIRVEAVAPS
jgi:hypothetical protein